MLLSRALRGKKFGYLYRKYGHYNMELSTQEQTAFKTFGGDLKNMVKWYSMPVNWLIYTTPVVAAWYFMDWMNQEFERVTMRKQPGQFDHEE